MRTFALSLHGRKLPSRSGDSFHVHGGFGEWLIAARMGNNKGGESNVTGEAARMWFYFVCPVVMCSLGHAELAT